MNFVAERVSTAARVVPLPQAVDINPRPERGSIPDDLDVSFVPMAAVEAGTGRMDASAVRKFGEVKKGYTVFREGDVLFAKITPCMENGKMAVARGLRNGVGCGSTEFHVLRPREGVDPHYIYHFVASGRFRAEAAHHMTGAVGQKRVPASFLEQAEIPLPDVDEQRRIVAEIEKQFSRLDEAVANLKRVKANLTHYRAAALSAAIAGEILPRVVEPAGSERHLAAASLGLPRGWESAVVEELCELIVDCPHSTARFQAAGLPCVDTTWMSPDGLVPDRARYVDLSTYAQRTSRLVPRAGDIVFAREGTIGTAIIIPQGMQPCLGQRVMLLRTNSRALNRYLVHALHSESVRAQYRDKALGSTVAHINVRDVKRLIIPLPPIKEQHRIVAEVDRRLSIVREVEAEVDANLKRAQALRQAVLARAFSSDSLGTRRDGGNCADLT